jgi:hypothetical protein
LLSDALRDAFLEASRRFLDGLSESDVVSDEQEEQTRTGRAKSLAKEFLKSVPANIAAQAVNKTQGEIPTQVMMENAITTKQASHTAPPAQVHGCARMRVFATSFNQ